MTLTKLVIGFSIGFLAAEAFRLYAVPAITEAVRLLFGS